MVKKNVSMAERIELPDVSQLRSDDIPQQAGTLSKTERGQALRVRKNVEEVVRSTSRGIQENSSAFQNVDKFEGASLPSLLERRQRLQPIREKLQEALYVVTDAELLTNSQIQRILLRTHEVVSAMETLNPGIARDFATLKDYVKTNDGKTQRVNANSDDVTETSS